ncbi:MAG: RNA ligase family protein, partial [Candidatus Nanoarchaeia archaeon]
MRKYPKIFRIGTEETKEILTEPDDCIYIEEKIDGANVRFQIQGGELVLGSRNVILDEPKHQWSKIYDYLFQRFKKMELINEDGLICIPNSYVFFGEFCIKHSINYDWEKMPLFLGFDIWDEEKGIFLSAEKARYIFSKIGLEFVPIVDILQVREISKIDENMIPMSKFYNGKAEGIVLKNYNKQIFAKFVTES